MKRLAAGCMALLLCGCGARSDLDRSAACEPGLPWLVFDYGSPQGGPSGISAMRADGSAFHALTLPGGPNVFPSIAPDSMSMVYLTQLNDAGFNGTQGIEVFDFATGEDRTVASLVLDQQHFSGLGMSAVAPDDQLIAYVEDGGSGVHIVGFDGSNDRTFFVGPYNGAVKGRPVFSASSSTLYATTFGHLYSMNTDGTAQQELMGFASYTVPNPSFSPDHSRFVAQAECGVDGASELRIYAIDELPGDPCTAGTKLVDVGDTPAWNSSANAAWGPSNLIAYESGNDIMVIDPGGGEPRNLTAALTTSSGDVASDPTWASHCAQLP